MASRRTEYPPEVLRTVEAEIEEADAIIVAALQRLEEETIADENRSDWGDVPALETGEGHETRSDAQLRVALRDARDGLAAAEDLLDQMLDDEPEG